MFSLEAKIRTASARDTRLDGMIPAVVYGKDVPSTMIAVGISDFIKVYRESGKSQIITLTVDGKKYNTLVQEAQRHPVSGAFLHLDFINVDMKSEVEVQIPLTVVGNSPAVLEGGSLHQSLHDLTVKCLPKDIVESIEVDVSTLETGHTIHVSDLKLGKKFQIMNHAEEAIVTAHAAKKGGDEEAAPAEEAPAAE